VIAQDKILGIFGGMGPEATVRLYQLIVELTPAVVDQEHIPTIMYSLPQVPERTECIRNNDPSIIPFLIEGVTRLENAGASLIAIPCNTVHYYYDYMQEAVNIPVIHMIRETVNKIRSSYKNASRIGLLATAGTIESGMYETELSKNGLQIITPDKSIVDEKVMKAVAGIKAGTDHAINRDLLTESGQHLLEKGAELIILGCTEIPLAYDQERIDIQVLDASIVLAERSIEIYRELT
jgi:aspartate racemase